MSSCGGTLVGKYRGKVISTEDLTMRGRLLCEVPSLPGMLLNWASPAVPYAGVEQGFFALPEEGSDVWIEFERGDANLPIWSGGYWEEGLEPLMPELSPELPEAINVLRSKFCTLVMNDLPEAGGVLLSVTPPATAVPVTVTLTSAGFAVTVGPHTLTINPAAGITLTSAESIMRLAPTGLTVETPMVSATAAQGVSVTAPTTTVDSATTINLPLTVNAPAVIQQASVETGLEVEGPSTLAGGATVIERLTVLGAASIDGTMEMVGESNFTGAVSVEGDVEVAGVILAPSAETVAAVAEVALVP
jgi:Type VI secretion system/phage-baseplate injector OB domain